MNTLILACLSLSALAIEAIPTVHSYHPFTDQHAHEDYVLRHSQTGQILTNNTSQHNVIYTARLKTTSAKHTSHLRERGVVKLRRKETGFFSFLANK